MLYIFDAFVLDTDRRELRHGSASVDIEPQVFDLLEHLIRNRDRVVSRDELIKSVWGGRHVSESALNTRINAARSAIGDSGAKQRLIKTLPRKGIRFVGETRQDVNTVEGSFRSAAERRPVELAGAYEDRRISDLPAVDKLAGTSLAALPAPLERHRFAVSRETGRAVAAIGILCFAFLTWSYFAHSVQSERRRTNVQVAARLTRVAEQINMISREDDEAVRTLEQWAVDLDPQNAAALARLTFAITTGVLNHWSNDVVTDLHAADQALQNAVRIAPNTMIVRGAQCHILRAMRQFEAAIKVCSEVAHDFSKYPFPHKEIGYNKLMLGQLDEALAEFLEADRLAPDSRMRWSWNQGIGLVYLMEGQDQKAIALLSSAALEAPNAGHPAAYLAAAYALAGRKEEAHAALEHYIRVWPNTSISNFGPMVGTAAFNGKMTRIKEGLRLAGLPD